MIIIGICGTSGSGKSSACEIFSDLGCAVLDCDRIYHEMTNSPSDCLLALVAEFGPKVMKDGRLDREALREIVFNDAEKLRLLNQISHSYIKEELKKHLRHLSDSGAECVLLDAPTLFEAGIDAWCDHLIAVTAPKEDKIRRICHRDGLSVQDAMLRLKNQRSDEFLIEKCDFVLRNNGSLEDLTEQCKKILNTIQNHTLKEKRELL